MKVASQNPKVAASICACVGFVLFQFWGNATHGYISTNSLFYWWVFQWINPDSETQHAWLILALSLFILGRNLARLPQYSQPMTGWALSAMVGGLLLHAAGFVAQQPRVSIVALLVYLWGILGLAGGGRWGRASMFPIAFMVFAIPVNALDSIGFWLQMWVVQSGSSIVHMLGIGVIRNGTQLFAPDGRYQYDVVAACSGIRSLMALMSLSLFIGYLWFKPIWLRSAMFLLSLPLVYFGNVLRITAIVVAAQWRGQIWGDRVHDVMGFGVFFVVIAGIIGAAELIARIQPSWSAGRDGGSGATEPYPGIQGRSVATVVVLFGLGEALFLSYRAALPPNDRAGVVLASDGVNPVELPTFLGANWMGRRVEPDAVERTILPPDTGFSRKFYVNLDDPSQHVLLSVVLSGRDRTSIHRPELCVVGQGWTIDQAFSHQFGYPGDPAGGFEATVLNVHHEVGGAGARRTVSNVIAYWFIGDDRIVNSQAKRIVYDAWNRLARGRSPRWAYVFLQTDSAGGVEAALARIQNVLDSALPAFQPVVHGR